MRYTAHVSDTAAARQRLWWTMTLILIAVLIGGGWDQQWHLTRPFDGFFSPPHIFVYTCISLAALMVLGMLVTPRIRAALGVSLRLPIFPFAVPGAVVILGSGIVLAGIGGLIFDNIWHTNFGLDETQWSLPHAAIGWAELLVTVGIIACRLALRTEERLRWYITFFFGIVLIYASIVPFMGPLIANRSVAGVEITAAYSVLAAQPPAQHVVRVIRAYDLTRSNPALLVLASLWAGAILAFLRRLDSRAWVTLLVVGTWTVFEYTYTQTVTLDQRYPSLHLTAAPINWLPLPLLLPTLVTLLPQWRWVWPIAGTVFALGIIFLYALPLWYLLLVPIAALMLVLGQRIGTAAFTSIEQPATPQRVFGLLSVGIAVPFVTGLIDLAMRWMVQ